MATDPILLFAQQQASAAWVQAYAAIAQAILSVGAIIAAIIISRSESDRAERVREDDRQTEAKDLALLCRTSFLAWKRYAEEQLKAIEREGMAGVLFIVFLADPDRTLRAPGSITQYSGAYRRFGAAAPSIQAAVLATDRLYDHRDSAVNISLAMAAQQDFSAEEYERVLESGRIAIKAIVEACKQVEALLDAK